MKIIKIILIVVGILFLYGTISNIFSLPQLPFFKKHHIESDGKIIIEKIKPILKLYSKKYYTEFLADSGLIRMPTLRRDKRLLFIIKGEVSAGFDLEKLKSCNIDEKEKSITIKLDSPFIVNPISNPTDREVVFSQGSWPQEEIEQLIINYKDKIKDKALQAGILEQCEKSGKSYLDKFLKSIGYKTVNIDVSWNSEYLNFKPKASEPLPEVNKQSEKTFMDEEVSKLDIEDKAIEKLNKDKEKLEGEFFDEQAQSPLIEVATVRITTGNKGDVVKTEIIKSIEGLQIKKWIESQTELIKSTPNYLGDLPISKSFSVILCKRK